EYSGGMGGGRFRVTLVLVAGFRLKGACFLACVMRNRACSGLFAESCVFSVLVVGMVFWILRWV
ncbi:hypothetical protein A2U01_0098982, partial [Trifolium medium]|nr:hypothetical protein [Trifolium medium]